MNQFYSKILSIFLSFVVLFSSVSFSVDLHYCCDKLIDIGVFERADTCISKTQDNNIGTCELSDESCCHNKHLNKTKQDNFKKSFDDYFDDVTKIYIINNISYFDLFLELKENTILLNDYTPLVIIRDITILHESFLL